VDILPHCQFLEQDLKTQLPRKLCFTSSVKVIEIVERGGGLSNLESRQALDHAIEIGSGGVPEAIFEGHTVELCVPGADQTMQTYNSP
jgi:hypothetical protein